MVGRKVNYESSKVLRRSSRDRRLPERLASGEYQLLTQRGEPESYEEVRDNHQKEWMQAMQDEIK